MNEQEIQRLFKTCERFLGSWYPQTPKQTLSELAAYTNLEDDFDRYGAGELITLFEADVAQLLGKEAAVFMPSGTMCQQIALRIWTDSRKLPRVAFHPTCHLEIHEEQAYRKLHNLESVLVGQAQRMLTLKDLESIPEPLGALLLELPQREIGGQLPTWEEVLSSFPQIEILPSPPQTNMMHVFMQGDHEKLVDASLKIARETKTLLFARLSPTIVPHWSRFELTVGDASLNLKNEDIAELFSRLFIIVDNV